MPFDPSAEDRALRETTSQVLHRLTVGRPEDKVSFGDMLDVLGERSFGLLLILLALPNCIPFPGVPGVSFITGMAILYISIQLILARDEPSLPEWVSRKSFTRSQFARFIGKTAPLLRWLEKPIRPRLSALVAGPGERVIGLVALIHAITLALPIPMGNLPQGIALILLALALIELDGLMAVAGYAASIAAAAWLGAVVLGIGKIATTIFA